MSESMFKDFFARHSLKPKEKSEGGAESADYKGVSEKGVDLAKERSKDLLTFIDQAEPGSVIFLGGSSEAIRTKSTARVYGDEIKKLVADEGRNDVIVVTEIDLPQNSDSQTEKAEAISKLINDNADKKIFVDLPLFLKEFGMNPWTDGKGGYSEFTKTLLRMGGDNESESVKAWFRSGGKVGNLTGPKPEEVAKNHLRGLERLREFAVKYVKDRPIGVGAVGHSWNMDALAVYLANNGVVDEAGFEKVGSKMIGESEFGMVELTEDGKAKLVYRGNEYEINLDK